MLRGREGDRHSPSLNLRPRHHLITPERTVLKCLQICKGHGRLGLQIHHVSTKHHLFHFLLDLSVVLVAELLENRHRVGVALAYGPFEEQFLGLFFHDLALGPDAALRHLPDRQIHIVVCHVRHHFHVGVFEHLVKLSHLGVENGREIVPVHDLGHFVAVVEDFFFEFDHAVSVHQDESLVHGVRDDVSELGGGRVKLVFPVDPQLIQVLNDVHDGGGARVEHVDVLDEVELGELHHQLIPVLLLRISRPPVKHRLLNHVGEVAEGTLLGRMWSSILVVLVAGVVDDQLVLVLDFYERHLREPLQLAEAGIVDVVEVDGEHLISILLVTLEEVVRFDFVVDFRVYLRIACEPCFIVFFGLANGAIDEGVLVIGVAILAVVVIIHPIIRYLVQHRIRQRRVAQNVPRRQELLAGVRYRGGVEVEGVAGRFACG